MLPYGRQRSPTARKWTEEPGIIIDFPSSRESVVEDLQVDRGSSRKRWCRSLHRWRLLLYRRKWRGLGLVFLGVLWLLLLASPPPPSLSPAEVDQRYAAVIDAGSSGSRIMLYSWSKNGLALLPSIGKASSDWQLKIEPGISSFSQSPSATRSYLKPLLDFAIQRIPEKKRDSASLHLFATAGMRLLSKESQTAILHEACSFVKENYSFNIQDCNQHFQVITGEWEGIYGWLTVNYLKNGLVEHQVAEQSSPYNVRSYGFLDMGGASAQIAFEPSPLMAKQHFNDLTEVQLLKNDGSILKWNIFVTTFLEFGANEARRRYLDRLTQHSDLPRNSTMANSKLIDHCLPEGLSVEEHGVALTGSGKFNVCVKELSPLLNKHLPCPDKPCFFNGVHIPLLNFRFHRFIGVSEFWYSVFDVFGLGGSYNASALITASAKYCSSQWKDIETDHLSGKYPHVQDKSRLKSQCFKSGWLVNILYEGFGFPRENSLPDGSHGSHPELPVYFESVNEINNFTVSWTLGAVLHRVTQPS